MLCFFAGTMMYQNLRQAVGVDVGAEPLEDAGKPAASSSGPLNGRSFTFVGNATVLKCC